MGPGAGLGMDVRVGVSGVELTAGLDVSLGADVRVGVSGGVRIGSSIGLEAGAHAVTLVPTPTHSIRTNNHL